MFTLQDAKNKLEEYIDFLNLIYSQNYPELKLQIIIENGLTLENELGWIFFYQSNNETTLIAGNGPIFVEKKSLDMYQFGTALKTEEYLAIFEENKSKLPIIKKGKDGIWNAS